MRVRLIREAPSPNPEYSQAVASAEYRAGRIYDVPHTVTLPVGTELSDPHAWIHCVPGHHNSPPYAEPIDDAAKAMVDRWLKARALTLEWLMSLNPKHYDGADRRNIEQLQEVYGTDHEPGRVLQGGGDESGAGSGDAERHEDVRPVAKRSRAK